GPGLHLVRRSAAPLLYRRGGAWRAGVPEPGGLASAGLGDRPLLLQIPVHGPGRDGRHRAHAPVPASERHPAALPARRPPPGRHDLGKHPRAGLARLPGAGRTAEGHALREGARVSLVLSSRVWVTLLCLLGALRVWVFAAALPPFHPLDE